MSLVTYFAATLGVEALVPPPDGGYPNFTTAEGQNALQSLTTGIANTGIGWRSLFSDSTGSFNTGVGAGTLILNTADSNTAVGAAALLLNTTGADCVAVGTQALLHNTTAFANNAVGAFALFNNDSTGNGMGNFNNAHGREALIANTDGEENNAFGDMAMLDNTTGRMNTAMGDNALEDCVDGNSNVAIGKNAGINVVSGNSNIYIGEAVLAPTDESNTIRIGDNLPTGAGASACFIGGILSHVVPGSLGNPILIIDSNNQVGVTFDFSSQLAEQQKKIEEQQDTISQLKSEMQTMLAQLEDRPLKSKK